MKTNSLSAVMITLLLIALLSISCETTTEGEKGTITGQVFHGLTLEPVVGAFIRPLERLDPATALSDSVG